MRDEAALEAVGARMADGAPADEDPGVPTLEGERLRRRETLAGVGGARGEETHGDEDGGQAQRSAHPSVIGPASTE